MKRYCPFMAVIIGVFFLMAIWSDEAAAADCGEPVLAPKLSVGDKWVWRNDKGGQSSQEVVGIEGDLFQIRWADPALEPDKEGMVFVDPHGVIRKAIRTNGEVVTAQGQGRPYQFIGQRELDFPLQVGKRWDFTYMTRMVGFELGSQHRRVVACEEVSTPAGKFSALRIEVELRTPRWRGTYQFWYAPAVKNTVRLKYPAGWGRDAIDAELVRYELK
jgi:hypothetical protein